MKQSRKEVFFLVLTKYIDKHPRTVVNGHDVVLHFENFHVTFFNTHCVIDEKSYSYDSIDELLQHINSCIKDAYS